MSHYVSTIIRNTHTILLGNLLRRKFPVGSGFCKISRLLVTFYANLQRVRIAEKHCTQSYQRNMGRDSAYEVPGRREIRQNLSLTRNFLRRCHLPESSYVCSSMRLPETSYRYGHRVAACVMTQIAAMQNND
jgi:hypothetical protein